ncbi:hypothetical protein QJS10_CPA08g00887 [Acorus calamus]|uniref:Uncharacterized protein n=1 Tax=Acorus calamus TaxID=4465 RepID=A0AAV9EAS4_ACOCL|nr:hypothetical protein QJS10_CPA08g00887 [Acorus calamus]
MPLTRLAADAFGAVTVSLVSIMVLLGIFCIAYTIYFRSQIRSQGLLQLGYFNGPWLTRIALIILSIWWCAGEIIRLSLLKREKDVFSNKTWQKDICKFYILSNLGFTEPGLFLTLAFLLHTSVQKRETGTLNCRWNRKILCYAMLFSLPVFLVQLVLVMIGTKIKDLTGIRGYFTSTSLPVEGETYVACTYPLLCTVSLGLFDVLLISYLSFVGARMLALVINKRLQKRVYVLIVSILVLLPMRALFLGFSVMPSPGGAVFEALVFLGFLSLATCISIGIAVLVYCPVVESMAVRGVRTYEIEAMPFDDYYDGASLIANQSLFEGTHSTLSAGRNSDASTKRGSISFRTMIRDSDTSTAIDSLDDLAGPLSRNISYPNSPSPPGRTMVPLHELSQY